jgi:hypothetical protein
LLSAAAGGSSGRAPRSFTRDDKYLLSAGGADTAVIQWRLRKE